MDGDDEGLRRALLPGVAGRQRTICCHSATLSGDHAPNSLEAVQECVAAGVPRLEVDVRFAADDGLVCFHDASLDAQTTGAGRIADHTTLELRALTYRSAGESLALLEEVVDAIRGSSTMLQVDLKLSRPISPDRVKRLEQALAPVASQVVVGSQSPWNLRKFSRVPVAFDPTLFLNYTPGRRQAPYPRQRGIHGFWDDSPLARNPYTTPQDYLEARLEELRGLVPAAIEWMVDIGTVLRIADLGIALGDELARHGIELAAWTLQERDPVQPTLERLWAAGVATVITDVPIAVAAALRAYSAPVDVNPR
ncbi:glycerophosphodiester phosphodiesterase [Tepidiforma thermophila]|uniref:Glycerophosphoryl diester phosphodiesterase n=1 Tax=Tepidiforma thermophila (strain KCTC 52669 / CGMCC 1.13589 / G233) TaxID=2761530 RepID=A0A2A9HEH2_TEPT2|nr:glycerophosphodiester phosphodiesterase family protein [Tepidiforma thermophila]PFG74417.1 glycerophosphoryl diester phosphodiesterase [Tepidiforma thermophila]